MSDLFGGDAPDIDAQIREVKREIGQRAHVYPRLIDGGRLTRAKADAQTRGMQAVLATLERVKAEQAAHVRPEILAGHAAGDGLVA